MKKASAIVIGAGPAGLAAAACLTRAGLRARVVDKADCVGSAWHNHYDRLRLHTARARSGLPYLAMPRSVGRYPSRAAVIDYLEDYARHFALDVRTGCTVQTVRQAEGGWQVTHSDGVDMAEVVVFATGLNGRPIRPNWPGQSDFSGPILHSSDYRNSRAFLGQRVLAVGFGNSGGDIALDLAQSGVDVGLCVRGPINILPKEILGIPVTSLGLLGKVFPAHVADAITAPVVRALIGRPERYGLRQADKGPLQQVVEDGKIPLIDIGALAEIAAGRIRVHPGIARFGSGRVAFVDATEAPFDAVILATGYGVDLRSLLPDAGDVLDGRGRPIVSGGATGRRGLYFCSYLASPNGQLRQAGAEAKAIASDAVRLMVPG